LTTFVFVGGISSGSAMVIVTTVSLASMCVNHLLLPAGLRPRRRNVYRSLAWMRRAAIAVIVPAGFGFYRLVLDRALPLVDLGLISFVTVAQFLPGLVGLLFWRRATGLGFSLGLIAGMAVWFVTLVVPLFGGPFAARWWAWVGADEPFFPATFVSLTINVLVLVFVSWLDQPSAEEHEAARICCGEVAPWRLVGSVTSAGELRVRLGRVLGETVAERELDRALGALAMPPTETRPKELGRLIPVLERNLSALFGPLIARLIVEEAQRDDAAAVPRLADRLDSLEEQLRALPRPLEGTASELELFWRYLRDVLQDLPLGMCALAGDGTIVIWNQALATISRLESTTVRGCTLERIGEPWGGLFHRFLSADQPTDKVMVRVGERELALQLSKSRPSTEAPHRGWVLLVEDRTVERALEQQVIHQDRLASIGQLAAGLAHELGNPLTGIACVAQNLRDDLADADTRELLRRSLGESFVRGSRDEMLYADARERVQQILDLSGRIDSIVGSLLSFSRAGTVHDSAGSLTRVAVDEAVREAIALVHIVPRHREIEMRSRCDDQVTLLADHQHLVQVLVNLLANACDASPPGGLVEVTSSHAPGRVRISVADHGSGMSPEVQARVFEPFFTTKAPGKGTGLGLSLVYNIVRNHGGEVMLESAPGSGTIVTVELPERQL
jgi:signal transduction histidine kinase